MEKTIFYENTEIERMLNLSHSTLKKIRSIMVNSGMIQKGQKFTPNDIPFLKDVIEYERLHKGVSFAHAINYANSLRNVANVTNFLSDKEQREFARYELLTKNTSGLWQSYVTATESLAAIARELEYESIAKLLQSTIDIYAETVGEKMLNSTIEN